MQAPVHLKFNNTYNVKLIDSTDGKIKQDGTFHNIVTENFMRMLAGLGTSNLDYYASPSTPVWGWNNILSRIHVGNGSTEPSFTDNTLANKLWEANASSREYEWVDDYTIRGTAKYSFPANSSYVGTISEVGLLAPYAGQYGGATYYNFLMTRSLFTDSEGSAITFDKTDLDVLEISVTVEISIQSYSENFVLYKKPFLLACIAGARDSGSGRSFSDLGGIEVRRFYYDLENRPEASNNTEYKLSNNSSYNVSATYDRTQAQVNVSQVRLGTNEITSERYYKAISLPFLGYWKLPNEEVFPAYNIRNISIGVGDGSTTTFENPLNYFKENTEKIYKNGVPLIRGVDYNLNNIGNKDCLPELNDFISPIKVTTDIDNTSNDFGGNNLRYPTLMRAMYGSYDTFRYVQQFDKDTEAFGFDANSPLYVEYEEAVTLNCLKFTQLYYSQANGYYGNYQVSNGTVFYVDYSYDGEEYFEVASHTISGGSSSYPVSVDFEDKTAKYWRIRTNYSNGTGPNRYLIHLAANTECYMLLNRKDPDIVFTEAPAEGDILTMDVDMDVIMKNGNFVLDVGCSLTFTM